MSDEKIKNMFALLHEENKAIMQYLLYMTCYPKDYEKFKDKMIKEWDELRDKVLGME